MEEKILQLAFELGEIFQRINSLGLDIYEKSEELDDPLKETLNRYTTQLEFINELITNLAQQNLISLLNAR